MLGRIARFVTLNVLFVISFTCITGPVPVFAQEEEESEFSAHGYNVFRIEQEDKLLVPSHRSEEVWQFLHRMLVTDSTFLRKLNPAFTVAWSEEIFVDTYFDTPELEVLKMENGIRHRRRTNISNPNDRKSGRELLQVKLNNISGNSLERGELKYPIVYTASQSTPDDVHPVFGIVQADQREPLRAQVGKMGIDAAPLRPILTITDRRRRIYISLDGKSFLSVSHDEAKSGMYWAKSELVEIEPELNEIAFTEASPERRRYMESIGRQISGAILAEFPDIKRDLTPKYNKMFYQLEGKIPALRSLVRYDLTGDKLMLAALAVLALIGGAVFGTVRMMSSRKKPPTKAPPRVPQVA